MLLLGLPLKSMNNFKERHRDKFVVGVTGHRPDKLGIPGSAPYSKELFNLCCSTLAWLQPDVVISGMALGLDLAIAAAAKELNLYLVAAVPFDGHLKNQTYCDLIDYAKANGEVHVVSPGGYAPWKMQSRNRWIVDRIKECDGQLIALWNGEAQGGTWNCVRYARSKDVAPINIWPDWQRMQGQVRPIPPPRGKWIRNWFSNGEPFSEPLSYQRIQYYAAENFFQALKSSSRNFGYRQKVSKAPAFGKEGAKKMGRSIQLRPGWDDGISELVMRVAINHRYRLNTPDGLRLLETEGVIVEWNNWCDNLWGDCVCDRCKNVPGLNKLGEALTKRREELWLQKNSGNLPQSLGSAPMDEKAKLTT